MSFPLSSALLPLAQVQQCTAACGLSATLLLAGILVPLLLGFVLIAWARAPENLARLLGLVGVLVPFAGALFLWAMFDPATGNDYAFYLDLPTGLDAIGISLKLGLNGISLPLYVLAGVVGLAAVLYAVQGKAERLPLYLGLLLVMQGGLMGVFASVDLFFFYFFHEFALIPTFILIGIWGGRGRRGTAWEMAIYLTLGAMLSLAGLITLYAQSGLDDGFNMVALKNHLFGMEGGELLQTYTVALLLFGFGILVSLWPFHSWAPRTYATAPTAATMLHAGVLKKFGLYGLIQIAAPLLPYGMAQWTDVLVVLALGNVLLIGFVTMGQRDLKQMLGYSSVMHMGYAFLGIATLSVIGVGGAVFMMVAHGLSVALLFQLSTCIHHRSQTFDMTAMGGLAKQAPVLAAFFATGTLASIGLPGLANFWGELAIFLALWDFSPWIAALAVLGIVISAIYGLRAVANIFFGPMTPAMQEATRATGISDLRPLERLPALLLIVALLLFGFWPKSLSEGLDVAVRDAFGSPSAVAEQPAEPAATHSSLSHGR